MKSIRIPLVLGGTVALALACGGLGGAHPSPSDYGVDIEVGVDELMAITGYEPSKLASRQLEADMLETLNRWFSKDKAPPRFFAVSVYNVDWEIHRTRGNPTMRSVCGLFFWQDESGLCHGTGHRLKQDFDGVAYSDTFKYNDKCMVPSTAALRRYYDPLIEYPPDSKEPTIATHSPQGNVFEACSEPAAWASFMAAATAEAAKQKPAPKPANVPRPSPEPSRRR